MAVVDAMLASRDEFLAEVRARLLQAQEHARCTHDAKHSPLQLSIGEWVWLRLLHPPTKALVPGGLGKLGPKFAGPYQVVEKTNEVAYRLALPAGARIHDVFHVGVLKPFRGTPLVNVPALPPLRHGWLLLRPERVLRSSLRRGEWFVLVQWADMPASEATWEHREEFRAAHPDLQLEDELFPEEGRDVMVGNTYQRKRKARG